MQGIGGSTAVVVVDDLGKLVGQFPGEGDFIRLPGAGPAHLLKAQDADHLAVDADAGVEHGIGIVSPQAGHQLAGAWIAAGVRRIDRAAGVQGFEVVGEQAGVEGILGNMRLGLALEG